MSLLKVLTLTFLFITSTFGRGFVESQVTYDLDENGNKMFSMEWDEEAQIAKIEMGLRLHNYRAEWHDGGFDLNFRKKVYSTTPEFGTDCEVIEVTGKIGDGIEYKKSYMDITLKGPGCERYLFMYGQFGAGISFYDVMSIDGKLMTPAMRLYIVDNP